MGNGLRPYEHRPLSSEWRHFVHRDIGTRILLGEIVDALRASGHRHTDLMDFNGCHGYLGSQCFTVVNGVTQCGCTSCMRR